MQVRSTKLNARTSYGIVFWGELVDHMRCLLGSVSVDSNVQLLHFLTGDEFFGGLIKKLLSICCIALHW
ncbi:unnamed protein product [Camellia sinensis]